MSKDRFDRLDEDIFEKPPAPPVQVTGTRFTREDIIEAVRTQVELLRAAGVTIDPATVASIRDSEDQRILDALVRAAQSDPNPIVIDSLRQLQCPNCGLVSEGAECTSCHYRFAARASEPHRVSEPGSDDPEMPADPRAWLFHVGQNPHHEHESYSGRTWVVFTPIHYWRMNHAQIDAHLEDEPIRARIPAYLEEVTDSTFIANAGAMTEAEIRDDLRNRGFQEDPAFASFIDGLAPVEPVYEQALAQNADVVFRTAMQASSERDDHELPGARNARLVRTLGGQVIGFSMPAAQVGGQWAGVTEPVVRPVTPPETEEELVDALIPEWAQEQERAQAHRRQAYANLLNVHGRSMWLFTVTQREGRLVLVLCHRLWWGAYQNVPDVRVLTFVNNWLPPWVHAEMEARPGAFWIDRPTSEGVDAIGELERLGLTLTPLLGPAAGFPV